MHMTDAEIRERSTLTLLRIIVRQEEEIEGLRKTLASTAQVAADAEKREADAVSAEHLHSREWGKPLPSITPESLRRLADGLANQNSEAERVAARYAASAELLESARDALAGWRYIREHHGDLYGVGWDRVERALSSSISNAERPQP